MDSPRALHLVIPSTLGVGELFVLKVRVLGPVRPIECRGNFNVRKPGLGSPFNLNVERRIQFVDDCLPTWQGVLAVGPDPALSGPGEISFDGVDQGSFPGDTRPIKVVPGFAWNEPGFHFLTLRDPVSGVEVTSNPCYVTAAAPTARLVWGDPHWQTFFSDGIRCPEELYHFAQHEAFLDFGAISDHMEGVTDRQWDYFQAVTNDWNEPDRFATLQGQEWTHHDPRHGAPGHRNIYFRGDQGPVLRSTDADCNRLEKLWARLDACDSPALAIPHHPANVLMGVDWDLGWNPHYEKAVEIYSVWGSSEMSAAQGNTRPLRHCQGESEGRHVRDALARGYRFGFTGGGDVHDGRPGLARHGESYAPRASTHYDQGLTAAWVGALTREQVFDALAQRQTYAATQCRIFLQVEPQGPDDWTVRAASEEGLERLVLVENGQERAVELPEPGGRCAEVTVPLCTGEDGYAYLRVETAGGNLAWSSPVWGDER